MYVVLRCEFTFLFLLSLLSRSFDADRDGIITFNELMKSMKSPLVHRNFSVSESEVVGVRVVGVSLTSCDADVDVLERHGQEF